MKKLHKIHAIKHLEHDLSRISFTTKFAHYHQHHHQTEPPSPPCFSGEPGLTGLPRFSSTCNRKKPLEITDWVVALCPTRHKIGDFEDVPQANLSAWYGKTKPNTTKAHIHRLKNALQHKINTKKLKLGLVAVYNLQARNGEGLLWFRHFTYLLT